MDENDFPVGGEKLDIPDTGAGVEGVDVDVISLVQGLDF